SEHDVATNIYSGRVRYRQAPPDIVLMLIGDVLSNLRAALDHIAWSLAGQRANLQTEFPIFVDRKWFSAIDRKGRPIRGSGLCKMHDMPTCAQRCIEQMQPY